MRNFILMAMVMVCTLGSATASNILEIETIIPERVLSSATVKPIVDLKFIPNSTNDFVKINNLSPIKEIRVYNEKGRLVSTKKHVSKEYNFDISRLAPGTYCFRIQINKEVVTKLVAKK